MCVCVEVHVLYVFKLLLAICVYIQHVQMMLITCDTVHVYVLKKTIQTI